MNAESISVVVPTHNRRAGLPALLDALAGQAAKETIVVVSAARDGSLELLQERAHSEPRLIPLYVEQPGAQLARQQGVERATADVVLMLDDDVIPSPGLVAGHLRRHRGERLLVVGYMPVARPPRRRPGEFPADLYSRTYENTCREYERDPETILPALWGGNLSLRRSDCLEVGLLVPNGGTNHRYHEDREFGIRCQAAGVKGVFDRSLLGSHHYKRAPDAYLRDSRAAGEAKRELHRSHRDVLGPLDPEQFAAGSSPPGSWLIRLARRRGATSPVRALLQSIVAVSGRLHAFAVESYAGHVLGAIEEQQAALDRATAR